MKTNEGELNKLFPERPLFGGFWKYLTNWNIVLQLIYFIIALANGIFGSCNVSANARSWLCQWRDFIFSTLAFPVGMFVTLSFWAVYAIDRALVWPAEMDPYVGQVANHMVHTIPMLSKFVNLFLVYHDYPSKRIGLMTTVGFFVAYILWIFIIAYFGGFWVYKVLEVLTKFQRSVFIGVCALIGTALFLAGRQCNKLIWSSYITKIYQEKISIKSN